MNESHKKAFYGYPERPSVAEIMADLFTQTGCEKCAKELFDAANFVEQQCQGKALSEMPRWIC